MDPEKIKPDGRVFGVNEIKMEILYKHKGYELKCYSWKEMTKTGRLEIAELKPKRNSLPEFKFRWDEGHEAIDIEIKNVSKSVERKFNKETEGYEGHHTRKVCKNPRTFEVLIKIPGLKVFHGYMIVPVLRKLKLSGNLEFLGNVERELGSAREKSE